MSATKHPGVDLQQHARQAPLAFELDHDVDSAQYYATRTTCAKAWSIKGAAMTTLMKLVVSMAGLTWLSLMMASAIRSRGWGSRAILEALGNREKPPVPSALAGRADRTAANTLENFVLFAALALVAQVAGLANAKVTLGAEIFCWARVAFIPIYIIGIAYVRTVAWAIGLVGLCLMVAGMLTAS